MPTHSLSLYLKYKKKTLHKNEQQYEYLNHLCQCLMYFSYSTYQAPKLQTNRARLRSFPQEGPQIAMDFSFKKKNNDVLVVPIYSKCFSMI